MSHELICAWLGIPPDEWPPDHYRLLGLPPGTDDVALIEQRVHERLDAVRRYQMMHPEQATEAMNRLAQAFVCLTEPASKQLYDSALLGERPAGAPPPEPEPLLESRDPLAWLFANPAPAEAAAPPAPPEQVPRAEPPAPAPDWVTATPPYPPPVRRPPPLPVPPPLPPPLTIPPPVAPDLPAGPEAPGPAAEEEPPPPPPAPPPEPVDPVLEAAQSSPEARRGLGSKRALYHRVLQTRELLRLWRQLGKYLADPERRPSRGESGELYRLAAQVEDGLHNFPLLGEAGQPGYMVVALNQLDSPRTIQGLSVSQRESLNRDWKAGLKFLTAHRDFLRAELRVMRRRTLGNRLRRRARAYLSEQPGAALLALLALLALGVALWRGTG